MCYWVGTKKVREEMLRRLQQDPEDEIAQLFYKTFVGKAEMPFPEHYVAIGKTLPQLSVLQSANGEGMQYRNMQWGLPWSYTHPKTGKTTHRVLINSTCEKAFFVHRKVIYSRRCVVPLDGYYEFFHFSGEVYPHFIYPVEGLFFAAGVWDEQVDQETGELMACLSLLTTQPNALAQKLHNNPKAPNGPRMLLLLPQDKITDYLDATTPKEDLQKLFAPYPDKFMNAYPVARFLRKEYADRLNTAQVRQKIDYPELAFA